MLPPLPVPTFCLCIKKRAQTAQRQVTAKQARWHRSLTDQNEDMTWFLNDGLTNNLRVKS